MTAAFTPMELRLDMVLAELRATTDRVDEAGRRFDDATRHARAIAALVRRDSTVIPRRERAVLVVDDDIADRSTLVSLLHAALPDVAVHGAESPSAADAALRARPYALVIVDYYLRGAVSGLEYVRSLGRGPRAAVITGCADVESLQMIARRLDVRVFARPVAVEEWGAFVDYVRVRVQEATS